MLSNDNISIDAESKKLEADYQMNKEKKRLGWKLSENSEYA